MKTAAILALALLGVSSWAGANPVTDRRLALIEDMEDLKTLLPAEQEDPVTIRFAPKLDALIEEGSKRMRIEHLRDLEARFRYTKRQMFAAMYKGAEDLFSRNPKHFNDYMQMRLNAIVARRELAKTRPAPKEVGAFAGWNEAFSDPASAELVFADGDSQRTGAGFEGFASEFQPRQASPEAGLSEPPAPSGGDFDEEKFKAALRADGASEKVIAAGLKWARAKGMDPRLVFALMKQESSFRSRATSEVGAQGLMQLMPDTARGLGVQDSFDVNQNVRGGTSFLASLWKSFEATNVYQSVSSLFSRDAAELVAQYSDEIKVLRVAVGKRSKTMINAAMASLKPLLDLIPEQAQKAVAAYNAGETGVRKHNALHRYNETRAYVAFVWFNTIQYYSRSVGGA